MRHDLEALKRNSTYLAAHAPSFLNDAWRDAIHKLCDEVEQLEVKKEGLRRGMEQNLRAAQHAEAELETRDKQHLRLADMYAHRKNQLEAEVEGLKAELRGERERLLVEMYNNDTISQVQFDHAIQELIAYLTPADMDEEGGMHG